MIASLFFISAALAADPTHISVAEAIQLAVDRNPDLRSAELSVRIAEIEAERARLDRFSADVSGSAGVDAGVLVPWSGSTTDETASDWDLRATGSIPLYAGGSTKAAITSADAGARIANLDRKVTERNLIRATYTAYWTLKGYDLLIQAMEEGLDLTSQALRIIESKADAGLAADIDVNRSKVDLFSIQETLVEQRAARAQAQEELLRLFNMPPRDLVLTDNPPPAVEEPVRVPDAPGAFRPEMERQTESVTQAEAAVRVAQAGALPSVSLWGQAGYGTSLLPTSPAFDPGFHEPTLDASAGLSFSWNIFDLFMTRDAVREAGFAVDQANAANASEQRLIDAEIRSAAADVEQYRRRAPLVRDQVALARDNLQIVQDLYGQGSATILDLFNAQSAFRQARSQEASLAVRMATAEYDLRWLQSQDPRGTP